jgi:hypothetical protein
MVTKSSPGVVSQLLAAGEDKVDLVSEVRLVVFKPSPGGGGAFLPPDQRGDVLELELGVQPPRVHRVTPHGRGEY